MWLLVSGGIVTGLGLLGLGACCLPIAGGIASVLGLSALYFHQASQWLIVLGIVLIIIGLILLLKKKKKCCK